MISDNLKYFDETFKDNINGSGIITNKIISGFSKWFKTENSIRKNEVLSIIEIIFSAFSNFALLFNFLNELALFTENHYDIIPSTDFTGFMKNYKATSGNSKIAANHFIKNVQINNKNILLHSNSSSVQRIFEIAKNQNINCTIWQTVSSPAGEGILQAEELANMGFSVNLIREDEIFLFKDNFDLVVLGCDTLTDYFFINKTGSYSITLLEIPIFIISETNKFVSDKNIADYIFLMLISETKKPAHEIYKGTNKNINALNYYFEHVPYHNITGIALETGFFKNVEKAVSLLNKDYKIADIFNQPKI